MKTVILAGGFGTRLSEETTIKPKPMVEIGGRPILWHIMKIYAAYGLHDFIICLGYKGYMIKEYFANYALHMSDVTIDMAQNHIQTHQSSVEPWRITLVDTGDATMTGGRIKRIGPYLNDEDFCLTYGDGVADIDIQALITFHKEQGVYATVTATRPSARFGKVVIDGDKVLTFKEKPEAEHDWINGGFFVLSPKVLDYIEGDNTIWEREPMENLARDGQMAAYLHHGFWKPMDTLRDKLILEELCSSGSAPWKIWQ